MLLKETKNTSAEHWVLKFPKQRCSKFLLCVWWDQDKYGTFYYETWATAPDEKWSKKGGREVYDNTEATLLSTAGPLYNLGCQQCFYRGLF